MGPWVLGVVLGLISLFGLFMASNATDTVFYGTGLFFTGVGVVLIFYLIHRHTRSGDDHG
ncbi:MAG: hypothetical protein ACOCYE_10470 [Pseudomonadota bacterium]